MFSALYCIKRCCLCHKHSNLSYFAVAVFQSCRSFTQLHQPECPVLLMKQFLSAEGVAIFLNDGKKYCGY